MVLEYGTLQLLEPAELRGHRLPIDLFFRSLAQSNQELGHWHRTLGYRQRWYTGVTGDQGRGRYDNGAEPRIQ